MLTTKTKIIIFGILALAAAPFAASAGTSPPSVTSSTTVTATITATISIVGPASPISLALAPTSGTVESAASGTYTVTTNDSSGYKLSIVDADTNTSLVQSGTAVCCTASSGSFASPAVLADDTWGYHIDGMGTTNGLVENSVTPSAIKWAGVPSSTTGPTQVLNYGTAAASGNATVIWYGVQADPSTPSGSGYTDNITITATGT